MSSSDGSASPQSLSFDRAAPLYDATRGYAPDVAEQIGAAIVEAAGAQPETRFIEVGVGTGRIALPIARLGYDYTGVDISEGMMARLRDKAAASSAEAAAPLRLQVVIADMTALPFPDASFDVAVAVHVFHLVRAWKQAVDEVLRVLRPGGLFLHCWDNYYLTPQTGRQSVQERWEEIVRELGGEISSIGAPRRSMVTDYLRASGLIVETLNTVTWTMWESPQAAFEYIASRTLSRTWLLPDALFDASIRRLESWATSYYGADYTTPQPKQQQFVINRARK